MKVLITSDYNSSNIYVKEIVDSLSHSCDVVCDVELFWHSEALFDIIHIQWPEELFNWKRLSENDLLKMEMRFQFWKQNNAKIIITRHNNLPHRKDKNDCELYDLVYKNSNGVIHLGNYSLTNFEYKKIINVIIQHPNYISLNNFTNKAEARKKTGIAQNKIVYLSFGKIRKSDEENQIIEAFVKSKKPNELIYICNSRLAKQKPKFFKKPINWFLFQLKIIRLRCNGVLLLSDRINNDMINLYFNAVDIIITPRIDSLNSGVVYLAYSFSKIVIGPKIGNIQELLENLGNSTYIPNDEKSISNAIIQSRKSINTDLFQRNFDFVKKECDSNKIAIKHFQFYESILSIK